MRLVSQRALTFKENVENKKKLYWEKIVLFMCVKAEVFITDKHLGNEDSSSFNIKFY